MPFTWLELRERLIPTSVPPTERHRPLARQIFSRIERPEPVVEILLADIPLNEDRPCGFDIVHQRTGRIEPPGGIRERLHIRLMICHGIPFGNERTPIRR